MFEFAGKIMNRGKAEHAGYFRDRVCAFLDEELSLVQLEIADVLLGRGLKIVLE